MPVVKDGQQPGPSHLVRVEATDDKSEPQRSPLTYTPSFDSMLPWLNSLENSIGPNFGGSFPAEQPSGGSVTNGVGTVVQMQNTTEEEYDSSDEKDSITPEILAATGGIDPRLDAAVPDSLDCDSVHLLLVETSSEQVSPVNVEDSLAVAEVKSTTRDVEEENGFIEWMQLEIQRLANKVIDLDDENQDYKIFCGELQHTAFVAAYLEYEQRMELAIVSMQLKTVEEENRALTRKISAMELMQQTLLQLFGLQTETSTTETQTETDESKPEKTE